MQESALPVQQGVLPLQQGALPLQQGALRLQQGALRLHQGAGCVAVQQGALRCSVQRVYCSGEVCCARCSAGCDACGQMQEDHRRTATCTLPGCLVR